MSESKNSINSKKCFPVSKLRYKKVKREKEGERKGGREEEKQQEAHRTCHTFSIA